MDTTELTLEQASADRQYARAMKAEREVWTGWMERALANGPRDSEAAAAVHQSAIRYAAIATMRRQFGDPWFSPDLTGYRAKDET